MSKQTRFPKCSVLGLEVDAVTITEAIDHIVGLAGDAASGPRYVVKPYVEFVPVARRRPEVMELLNNAELCLADGVALQWAAAYQHRKRGLVALLRSLADIVVAPNQLRDPIAERHGGANFTLPLLRRCADAGLGVYLIGSPTRNPIDVTADHLRQQLPALRITGMASGHLSADDEVQVVAELRAVRPDIVLVGMGFPRQEELIARVIPSVDHGIFIGEGGTFDYQEFGGGVRRAPALLQRAGLEWAWRLALQPSRFRRQLAIPRFIADVYRERCAATSR